MNQLRFKDGKHLSHAYIVSAASEEARSALSLELAQALVCSGGGEVPCGVCRDCRKTAEGIHPDVVTIERQTDDKGNRKREIFVDQVRYMVSDAYVLPNEAERKVYIVKDADTMNASAQNAALKLLEEPPRAAAFILCAANPGMLLPTVRSRCEIISRNSAPEKPDEAAAELADGFIAAAAAKDRAKILAWCMGNEDMDTSSAAAFAQCAAEKLDDMLCLRAPDRGMERKQMMELAELMKKCGERLAVNTGVKHVLGLLAVDAAPQGRTTDDRSNKR